MKRIQEQIFLSFFLNIFYTCIKQSKFKFNLFYFSDGLHLHHPIFFDFQVYQSCEAIVGKTGVHTLHFEVWRPSLTYVFRLSKIFAVAEKWNVRLKFDMKTITDRP